MKRLTFLFLVFLLAMMCAVLVAQEPPASGARRGGMRGMQGPPASGPMLDIANKIVDAINKQDAATLQKILASDAVFLDEDGHAPPALNWIAKLTSGTPAKRIEISATHRQMWGDAGWVSFNYTLTETFQGQPKTVKGTASIVLRKPVDADWQIQLVHSSLYRKVAGITQ